MARKFFLLSLLSVLAAALMVVAVGKSGSFAAEKFKYGTPNRLNPLYVLPPLAAEDKGFWKQQGLDVEFTPFKQGSAMAQALAAGAIHFGARTMMSLARGISRGLPAIVVADTGALNYYYLWVPKGSRIKGAKDLKGAKIGVGRLGGTTDAFARMLVKALGMEKDVKIVAGGGIRAEVAAMKTGRIDGRVSSPMAMARFKFAGDVHEVLGTKEYLPKEWVDVIIFSSVDVVKKRPQAVRGVIKGFFQATSFMQKDRGWAIAKMKSYIGYSDALANNVYPLLKWGRGDKISKKAVENILDFLSKYKLLPRGKAAPLANIYTNRFVE